MNVSGSTCVWFKISWSVPVASSRCNGTTQPIVPVELFFLSTTWLPRCRTRTNPSFSRARIAAAPDTRGSLGMRHVECCNQGSLRRRRREFFQVEFCRFLQVGNCFGNTLALAHDANLGTDRYIPVTFPVNHGGVGAHRSGSAYSAATLCRDLEILSACRLTEAKFPVCHAVPF